MGFVALRVRPIPTRFPTITWIKTKREGVKSGRSGAHKPDKLGVSCKVNKCSDAEIGDLGVLPTHEALPCLGDAG